MFWRADGRMLGDQRKKGGNEWLEEDAFVTVSARVLVRLDH